MARDFEVQVIGLQKVEGALRHLPVVLRPFYQRAARYGQERMKEHAKPQHGVMTHMSLAEGVAISIEGSGYGTEAHVGFLGRSHGIRSSLGALAPTVNYGRRAGKPPSITAIRRWLRLMNAHVSPRTTVERIRERGTKGKFFLEQTADELNQKLPEIVRETERDLRAFWGQV